MHEFPIIQMFAELISTSKIITDEKLTGVLIAALIVVLLYIIWLISSLMSKLMAKQEKVQQGSYSQLVIRKITEKGEAEERLITPAGPIVKRKYC